MRSFTRLLDQLLPSNLPTSRCKSVFIFCFSTKRSCTAQASVIETQGLACVSVKHDGILSEQHEESIWCLQGRKTLYRGSSRNGRSGKRTALLTAIFTKPPSYSTPMNSVFLHSRKRPAPVTNTFLAARGFPLKRSSTVLLKRIHLQTDQEVTELQLTQITEMTSILHINQTHMFTVNSTHEQILP